MALLTGCIRDEACDMGVSLTFTFDFTSETLLPALSPDDARKAHLYVFHSADGRFVASSVFDRPRFDTPNRVGVTLAPGVYDFVLWFNQETPFYTTPSADGFVKGHTLRQNARLELDLSLWEGDVSAPILFYAKVDGARVKPMIDNFFVAPLTLNTHRIRFTAKGLSYSADTFRFSITDNSGAYDFDNDFASFRTFDYGVSTTFVTARESLQASVDVLRLAAGRTPAFTMRNLSAGETLYPRRPEDNVNLVELILDKYPDIDFDRYHLFDIILTFDIDMRVTVDVHAWNYNGDDYNIFPD
jgi:hypothetical protein